jgi:hypothetical protein
MPFAKKVPETPDSILFRSGLKGFSLSTHMAGTILNPRTQTFSTRARRSVSGVSSPPDKDSVNPTPSHMG